MMIWEQLFSSAVSSKSIFSMGGWLTASTDAKGGWLPRKWLVSISIPWIFPEVASWTIHQSLPSVRLRRLSHPSIHLPRSVYLSGIKMPRPGFSRFSFSAKKSYLYKREPCPRAVQRQGRSGWWMPVLQYYSYYKIWPLFKCKNFPVSNTFSPPSQVCFTTPYNCLPRYGVILWRWWIMSWVTMNYSSGSHITKISIVSLCNFSFGF